MRKVFLRLCLAAVCTHFVPHVWAQQRLEPIVVEGTPQKSLPLVSPRTAEVQLMDNATVTSVDSNELSLRRPQRVEDLAGYQAGVLPGIEQGGLGTALVIRGVEVNNRVYVNGQIDFQRRFVRDFASIESVTILRGPASTLFGFGSPAGAVIFDTKRPMWMAHGSADVSGGSNGYFRSEIDVGTVFGGTSAVRLISATQQGRSSTQNVDIDRDNTYATLEVKPNTSTKLRVEFEEQINRRPFAFGTVYLDGRVIYDAQYVAPQSNARRTYDRASVYADHEISPTVSVHAAASTWRANRDETLVGFWTIESPTELSGYYTKYHDQSTQQSVLLEARAQGRTANVLHHTVFGFESNAARATFVGTQAINSFSINPYQPDFIYALTNLGDRPRNRRERTNDSAFYAQDRMDLSASTALSLGVRRTEFEQATSRSLVGDLNSVISGSGLSYQAGGVHRFAGGALHANYARVIEPNGGTTRDGAFLPPKANDQAEIGWRHITPTTKFGVTAFRIVRKNDGVTDPIDKNALVAAGKREFKGLEVSADLNLDPWRIEASASSVDARTIVATSAGQGNSPPNVPKLSGAIMLHRTLYLSGTSGSVWMGAVAVGKRFGDEANSFTVPGYVRIDAGLQWIVRGGQLSLNGRNLTNKTYVQAITAEDNVFQGERRSWWLSARWSF